MSTIDDAVADLNDILEQTGAELKSTRFVSLVLAREEFLKVFTPIIQNVIRISKSVKNS